MLTREGVFSGQGAVIWIGKSIAPHPAIKKRQYRINSLNHTGPQGGASVKTPQLTERRPRKKVTREWRISPRSSGERAVCFNRENRRICFASSESLLC